MKEYVFQHRVCAYCTDTNKELEQEIRTRPVKYSTSIVANELVSLLDSKSKKILNLEVYQTNFQGKYILLDTGFTNVSGTGKPQKIVEAELEKKIEELENFGFIKYGGLRSRPYTTNTM